MSSRALRKALREKESEIQVEEQDLALIPSKSKSQNAFNLLDLQENLSESDSEFEIPEASNSTSKMINSKPNLLGNEQKKKVEKKKSISPSFSFSDKSIFSVNLKTLNYANELAKNFGSSVVQRNKSTSSCKGKRSCSQHFVDAKGNWDKILMGNAIEMLFLGETKTFQFKHSLAYQELQSQFVQLVEMSDPQILADFLRAHPLHIDTMLILSDVSRMAGEISTAAELVERAVYTLERTFHQSFLNSIAEGSNSHDFLSYSKYENRALFLALYRHLQFTMRKGCWKTAFELGKFLYNLAPQEDPLGMVFILDFLALKAEDYNFLLEFYSSRLQFKLANWEFSKALALYLSQNQSEADEQLIRAIISFPGLLSRLGEKCNFHLKLPQISGIKEPIFCLDSDFWNDSQRKINNLEKLFVERAHLCFKMPNVCSWIQRILSQIPIDSPEWFEACSQRKESSQAYGFAFFRHLLLADVEDSKFYIPKYISERPTRNWDLIPPLNSSASYADSFTTSSLRPQSSRINPILNLLNSFLPFGNDDSIIQDAE